MLREGFLALPLFLRRKVITLEHESDELPRRTLARFATQAARAVKLRGEVHLRITSSREMKALNLRFRKKNKATDVLSFPADTPKVAGDIAISEEIAAANAAELGHSLETELKVLILHGLLHLAGYDHESDDGEMYAQEAELRRQFKLPLGLIERAHATASQAQSAGRPGRRK
jgi:probable rRNA maturation factor